MQRSARKRKKRCGTRGREGCNGPESRVPMWITIEPSCSAPCIFAPDGQSINTLMGPNCRFYLLPQGLCQMPNALSVESLFSLRLFSLLDTLLMSCSFFSILRSFTSSFLFPSLFFFRHPTASSPPFSWIYHRRKTMYLECILWNRFLFIRRFGNSLQMRNLRLSSRISRWKGYSQVRWWIHAFRRWRWKISNVIQ